MVERIRMNANFWTMHFQWFARVDSICILTYTPIPLGNKWSFHPFIIHLTVLSEEQMQAEFCK